MQQLAEKLVKLRKDKGLSQLKLAEMMDVSRQAVSRWEVGIARPSAENLLYLSKLYDVTLEHLLNDEDISKREKPSVFSEEDGAKGTDDGNKLFKSKKRVLQRASLIVLCLLAVIIVAILYVHTLAERKESLPIKDMNREEVVIEPESSFDLEW